MNILERQRLIDERRDESRRLSTELRDARIRLLATVFKSEDLRAAADEAFARELEDSLRDYPCDEVIK